MSSRPLPARADLEQQKKLAKELLAGFERGESDARARVRAQLPDKPAIALADAQFVLAREYGFTDWRTLKEHLKAAAEDRRPPLERFISAVKAGDAKALRRVLENHPALRHELDEPHFSFDAPAIVRAAESGNLDVLDVLLAFGADPNRRTRWWAGGFHPLHVATGATAERLLQAGSVPDACAAAHLDRIDMLRRLLDENPSRAVERGGDGQTPLHFARSRLAIDLLLAAGADLDARDVDHRSTPAEWMLDGGKASPDSRRPLAAYLVARGASADIFLAAALGLTERAVAIARDDPSMLQLRTGQGSYGEQRPSSFHIYLWSIGPNLTPLQTAARFGQQETLMALEAMAPPEQQLLLACHEGNVARAHELVRENPGIVEGLQGADRRALTDEAWTANARAVELMMALGFDPAVQSVSGPTGGTALHCAAWEGSTACVSAILRYPAGRVLVDVRDLNYHGTPLSWCCHGSTNCGSPTADHAAVARQLIGAGAQVDPTMSGCSEAMQAVVDAARRRP